MNYIFHLIVFVEIYCILSLSLNLIVGSNGLLSLSHSAFYGMGSYITVYFVLKGFSFPISLVITGILVSGISVFISVASLRFKGDIFILVTLAFQVIFFSVVYNWVSITQGPYGISGIPQPNFFGSSIFGIVLLYTIITITIIFIIWKILKSSFSLSVYALRDNELAAVSLGKNIFKLRSKSISLAAAFAGISGGMYASYITYIDPTSYTVNESILLLSMVLFGGTGNIRGPIVGGVSLVLFPELLRLINIPDAIAPNIRLIVYGIALILLMYVRPRGVAGQYRFE